MSFGGTLTEATDGVQLRQGVSTSRVVATNCRLSVAEATKVAEMAHDSLARAIRPSHTMHDGDTIFALATGAVDEDATRAGILAADVFADAILRAVWPR